MFNTCSNNVLTVFRKCSKNCSTTCSNRMCNLYLVFAAKWGRETIIVLCFCCFCESPTLAPGSVKHRSSKTQGKMSFPNPVLLQNTIQIAAKEFTYVASPKTCEFQFNYNLLQIPSICVN